MKLFFLEADMPLVKEFSLGEHNELIKTPYPNVYRFTSHEEQCASLADFYKALVAHAKNGRCLLKGVLRKPLINESRAGSTDPDGPTDWICLDFDGAPFKTVEDALDALSTPTAVSPFKDVSYIVQYSASHGFKPGLNCHVFMQLSNQYLAPYLKAWLQHLNLSCPAFTSALTLNATATHLTWPLDVTTCQNDKLLFIAPPVVDPKIYTALKKEVTPVVEKERYQLVKKKHNTLPVERIPRLQIESVKRAVHDRRNDLRDAAGMHKMRVTSVRLEGDYYTINNPGEAVITSELREANGFVHFNLNGGDSWAYYHPVDNYKYIYSFKEPDDRFLTEKLLPSYYRDKEAERVARNTAPTEQGEILLTFNDLRSSSYWRGLWNPRTNNLVLHTARSKSMLDDWRVQHGRDPEEYVPVWDMLFDPHSNVVVDAENRRINTYIPTTYMRNSYPKSGSLDSCPTIKHTLAHMLNCSPDDELLEHFLNWLAVIYQHRVKTRTAWLLSGEEGTGKGILANEILKATLGEDQAPNRPCSSIESPYNGWMEKALVVILNEADIPSSREKKRLQDKMKHWITEPTMPIRNMYQAEYEAVSYANFILPGNTFEIQHISEGDRRYNVANFQPMKLMYSQTDIDAIRKELNPWMEYIMTREADMERAGTTIKNEARSQLIEVSRNSVDQIARHILKGNFMELFGELPNMDLEVELHGLNTAFASHYDQIIRREAALIVAQGTPLTEDTKRAYKLDIPVGTTHIRSRLSREELQTIFEYTIGSIPSTPTKIAQFLRHRGIVVQPIRINDVIQRGIYVDWYVPDEQLDGLRASIAPKKPKLTAVSAVAPIKKAKVS